MEVCGERQETASDTSGNIVGAERWIISMELRILSPHEDGFVKKIEWNHEELKAAIAAKVQDYKGLQYTEEAIKEAKKDKANLNKLKDAIETERKRIKKQCMEPYELFEKQVNEIVRIIEKPIQLIDAQIKEVEEQRRIEKKGKVLEIYEDSIGTLKGILPFEKVFKSEYLNVSKSVKSITEEIQALVSKVNQDMDTIEELHTKHEFQVKDMYIRTFDLSMALRENARLEEVERKIAERKAQEEAGKEAADQKREPKEKAAVETAEENRQNKTIEEEAVERKETRESTQIITIDFRVTATAEQFNLLKAFLKNNHITYYPVPKE